MTEDELDQTPPGASPLSADIDLGSHLPNPLNSNVSINNPSARNNSIKKVPGNDGMAGVPMGVVSNNITDKKVPSGQEVAGVAQKNGGVGVAPNAPINIPSRAEARSEARVEARDQINNVAQKLVSVSSREARDQINNVAQKELAMSLEGVTRRKTYQVISKLLEAKKWSEVTDKGGNVRWEWVDDLEKQRQGAEMALRVMGDMIEHKQVEYGIADSTLEKLKGMSVADLKMRAAELLEGRRKAVNITDAVVVR